MSEIFDFGFTAVDEQELEAVQITSTEKAALEAENKNISSSLSECQERLDKLHAAVKPLLNNLKENPEKDYIYWPDRQEKVVMFENYLQDIYLGI